MRNQTKILKTLTETVRDYENKIQLLVHSKEQEEIKITSNNITILGRGARIKSEGRHLNGSHLITKKWKIFSGWEEGETYFASAQTSIVVADKIEFSLEKELWELEGRYLVLMEMAAGETLVLINIYSLNCKQHSFWKSKSKNHGYRTIWNDDIGRWF